jgi:hypothetical protein
MKGTNTFILRRLCAILEFSLSGSLVTPCPRDQQGREPPIVILSRMIKLVDLSPRMKYVGTRGTRGGVGRGTFGDPSWDLDTAELVRCRIGTINVRRDLGASGARRDKVSIGTRGRHRDL